MPSTVAFLVVLLVGASGFVLRRAGVINPAISTSVSGQGVVEYQGADGADLYGADGAVGDAVTADPRVRVVYVSISNHSRSTVTVTGAHVVRPSDGRGDDASDAPLPVLTRVDGRGLRIAPGDTTTVTATLTVSACRDEVFPTSAGRYAIGVDLRTAWGRTKTVATEHPLTVADPSCKALVAHPDDPPDAQGARTAILRAFTVAYDATQPATARAAAIDDTTGLDQALADASTSGFATQIRTVQVRVRAIGFVAPDRARVVYDLIVDGSPMFGARTGAARLVDGTWRVTRATLCADLALADVTCPAVG